MKKFLVIGNPVEHSLSPKLHNYWIKKNNLDAIYGKAEAHNSSIPNSKKKILLGQILTEVHKPIISKVEGNVYAGGYIYLACSTYVIASDDLEFSLPEVKRGIFPMQVMGLLMRVMMPRNIIDWCIRGYSLSAKKAKKWGLISKAVPVSYTHLTLPTKA